MANNQDAVKYFSQKYAAQTAQKQHGIEAYQTEYTQKLHPYRAELKEHLKRIEDCINSIASHHPQVLQVATTQITLFKYHHRVDRKINRRRSIACQIEGEILATLAPTQDRIVITEKVSNRSLAREFKNGSADSYHWLAKNRRSLKDLEIGDGRTGNRQLIAVVRETQISCFNQIKRYSQGTKVADSILHHMRTT